MHSASFMGTSQTLIPLPTIYASQVGGVQSNNDASKAQPYRHMEPRLRYQQGTHHMPGMVPDSAQPRQKRRA